MTMINQRFRLLLALMCLLLLSGCSSTNMTYYETLKIAFTSSDVVLSSEQVRQSQADLLSVKHGDRDNVVMALAYIEDNSYKWVSADHAILTMHEGVIIESHGLAHDILYTSNLDALPLSSNKNSQSSWEYTTDIRGFGYGLDVSNQWHRDGEETLTILGGNFDTYIVEQNVFFPSATPFFTLDNEWSNRYWYNKANGEMLKSEQRLYPGGDRFSMIYLSRAQRYLDEQRGNL